MDTDILQIKFRKGDNQKLSFDFVYLEELLSRKNLSHSPLDIHRVDFFVILIITEGIGRHTVDFKEFEIEKGSVLTIRKDQVHRFHSHQAKGLLMLFTEDFVAGYLETLEAQKTLQLFNELLGSPKLALTEKQFDEIMRTVESIQQEFDQLEEPFAQAILRSLLHILISQLFRVKSKRDHGLGEKKYLSAFISFQQLVEQQCFQTKTVKDYASQMGYSTKTLNTIVKSIVGKTAKAFIDEIVIMQIKRLLIHSPKSIKEIAYQAGFEEPTNLFKYFRKLAGVSPASFRKDHLG